MIYAEDPFRRRPEEATERRKRHHRCVRMERKMTKWPSKCGSISKIRPSDGCGGETIAATVKFACDRHGFENYMGNIG